MGKARGLEGGAFVESGTSVVDLRGGYDADIGSDEDRAAGLGCYDIHLRSNFRLNFFFL